MFGNTMELAKMIFAFLEKPTGMAVLVIGLVAMLMAYIIPLGLVTGAFMQVGEKVIAHVDQGFDKMERALESHDLAISK